MSCRSVYLLALVFATSVVFAEQQFADIGDLKLVSGGIIKDCRVGYRTYGELNDDHSNVLIFTTWFGGTTGDLESSGVIGPGSVADTDKYFVIEIDALGNGVSSSPSDSDDEFPDIAIEDMVNSQHELLTEHLGIKHAKAVMGISMGGMQVFRWLASYPDFQDFAVIVSGSPRFTSYDLHRWQTHKDIVLALQNAGYDDSDIGVLNARLGLLTLQSPDFFVENIPVENLPALLKQSEQGASGFVADDYVSQVDAMLHHDVLGPNDESARAYVDRVKARVLMIGTPSDHIVNQTPAKRLAPTLGARYFELESNCGHMLVSCERNRVAAEIAGFLTD